MKTFKFFSTFSFLIIFFISCNPNDGSSGLGNDTDAAFAHNFGKVASRDFIGQVVDTDNNPLQGVTITIGTATAQTDVNGVFIINGVNVHEKFAYITATKTGYIEGSRAMVPTTGKNNVRIMLLPNTPTATIQSDVASEVALPDGSKVNFDGAFKDETGAAYTGAVTVAMFHLLPSDPNMDKLMPGMLYAQTATNEAAVLATYGMLNVELRGAAGQKLNLAEGHTAEITMKIDDSQLAASPSSIPLWHFDEAKGYWKEDGVATKVGSNYVGEVSHFSWWNCDIPNSSILLTFTVVDSNNHPIPNLHLQLLNTAGFHATGSTDSNGVLSGILPANQALSLNIYGNGSCGAIYTATVGPYTIDTVVPTIVLSSSAAVSSMVNGTLLKCDETAVTNGYVLMHYGNQVNLVAVTNGTFSFNATYCSGNTFFNLEGVDYDALQATGEINYNFTPTTTAVGILTACATISEFVSYKIDSETPKIFLLNINATSGVNGVPGSGIYISTDNPNNPTGSFGFFLNGTTQTPGIYTSNQFTIESADIGYISGGTDTVEFNLTTFGNVGEYIDMTFNGMYTDSNSVGHTITGTIHVIRDN